MTKAVLISKLTIPKQDGTILINELYSLYRRKNGLIAHIANILYNKTQNKYLRALAYEYDDVLNKVYTVDKGDNSMHDSHKLHEIQINTKIQDPDQIYRQYGIDRLVEIYEQVCNECTLLEKEKRNRIEKNISLPPKLIQSINKYSKWMELAEIIIGD